MKRLIAGWTKSENPQPSFWRYQMNKKLADLFKSKVLANSAWLIVLQVFNTIVPLLTLPYITRVLGTSNYGVFSLHLIG
ncbi:MAG: oligosaccharide flippase family protein [Faecalibacterium prausnitzii]